MLKYNHQAKLVQQHIDYAALGVPVIRPDVRTVEFHSSWRQVPLVHRLMVWGVLPVVILGRLFGGTRAIWSQAMEQYDLPTPAEEEFAEDLPRLNAALLDHRDDRLMAALHRLHEQRCGEAIEVAVVYGAGHVPAIVRGLMDRYGYRPHSADWLTVADL